MKNHLSIDIETLGTSSHSVILSIGAIEFDKDGIGESFEINIDSESCTDAGLVIDSRTVMWWLGQSQEARNLLANAKKVPLMKALNEFQQAFNWKNKVVWCNGASFDFPILSNAFLAVGKNAPWAYYNQRDFRTLKNMVSRDDFDKLKVAPMVAHSALADAAAQALTTINIFNHFGDKVLMA